MASFLRWSFNCLMAAAILLGSGTGGENQIMGGEKPTIITLTEKDNAQKIKLKKGDILVLKLEAAPSTAFIWNVAKNNADILAMQGKAEFLPGEKKVVGGKQIQVLRFKAQETGTSDLELHYKRPFDKDKPPAKTFKVNIQID